MVKPRFLIALLFLLMCFQDTFAQDLYFSISGQDVKYETGDVRHRWEFWIRPLNSAAGPASIQVFDAGLGGTADAITGAADVTTTFALFQAGSLYSFGAQSITRKDPAPEAMQSIAAGNETRFQNRWVEFFKAAPSAEGWIVSVSASKGDDINNFRLKVNGKDWQIIAIDLSLGVVQSRGEDRFQLKPFFQESAPPVFTVAGEEDSKLELIDLFGNIRPVAAGFSDFEKTIAGVTNRWGIQITGSQARLNNLTISGATSPVLWIYEPLTVRSAVPAPPAVAIQPGQECKTYEFSMRKQGRGGLEPAKTIWLIEQETFSGSLAEHQFSAFGKSDVVSWTPLSGRYFPAWVRGVTTVTINQPPVLKLDGWKEKIAPGDALQLSAAQSSDPENNPLEFRWLVNGAMRGTQSSFLFNSLVPGTYEIRLVVRETAVNAGCTESDSTVTITVNTQPYVDITFPKIFSRLETVSFSANGLTDADGDSIALVWTGKGVVGSREASKTEVKHDSAGTFEIQLKADDYSGAKNASFTATARYRVNMEPSPQFLLPELSAPGVTIPLDAGLSRDRDRDPLLFKWTLSDGRTLSGAKQPIQFDKPGDYSIELLADDQTGVSNARQTFSRNIHINAPPVPDIVSELRVNQALVPFSGSGSSDADQSIVSWSWNFGDGLTGTGEKTEHLYAKPGRYTVTLTVDDGAGMVNSRQKTSREIVINSNPVAVVKIPALSAPGQPIALDASLSTDKDGKIGSYTWFADGKQIATGVAATHVFDLPGDHTITLVVRDDSGFEDAVSSASSVIRINAPSIPAFAVAPSVTEPLRPTQFSATGSRDPDSKNLQYTWKFSDGKSFTGAVISRSFENPGVFGFEITVDDGENQANSIQTVKGTVRVNQTPILITDKQIRSNTRDLSLSAATSYDPEGRPLDFSWTLPDGSLRKAPAIKWQAPGPGVHRLTISVDDREELKNSRQTETVEILINRPAVAVVDSVIESCTGQIIIFSSARCTDPDGDRFSTEWNFGDGTVSSENNPYHTYKVPGRYTAILKITDGFQQEPTIATIPVVVEGSPVARMSFADTTICVNTPILMSAAGSTDPNGPIGAYSWDFGDEQEGFGEKVTHLYAQPGVYTVTLRVNGSGSGRCPTVNQVNATVRVVEGPQAAFPLEKWISPGETVTLDGSASKIPGKLVSAIWTITADGQAPVTLSGLKNTFKTSKPGKLNVRLDIQVNNGSVCNSSRLDQSIQVNAAPELIWTPPTVLPSGSTVVLSAEGSKDTDGFITSWNWKVDGKSFGDKIAAVLPLLPAGKHRIELTVKDNSGTASGLVRMEKELVLNAPPVAAFKVEEPVFAGFAVTLVPQNDKDADGQTLESAFMVNGVKLPPPFRWIPEKAVNRITLIQNDKQNQSNSIDSLTQTIRVQLPPDKLLITPVKVAAGFVWKEKELALPAYIRLLDENNVPVSESKPALAGQMQLTFGWLPKPDGTKRFSVPVEVLEMLTPATSSISIPLSWNPANPFALLEAPEMNRPAGSVLLYSWFKEGRPVGSGKTVQVALQEGVNRFVLRVSEQGVAGSKPAEVLFTVTASNRKN